MLLYGRLSYLYIFACFLISFHVHGTEPDDFILRGAPAENFLPGSAGQRS